MTHRLIKNGELFLYGPVGGSFFSETGFTDVEVLDALTELDGDVTVHVNSGGGNAFQGVAIFNALKAREGKSTIVVDGIAASAASIIAMAGSEIVMREGSLMMIHNGSGLTAGTAKDHLKTVEALNRLDGEMARLYSKRSGQKVDAVKTMMDDETWMTPAEAVAQGFATSDSDDPAVEASLYDYRSYSHAPERLVAMATEFTAKHSGPQKVERTRLSATGTEATAAPTGETVMDPKSLTLSGLREQRPDLVAEIEKGVDLAKARDEGAKAERDRVAGIEAALIPGHEKIIAEMKADPTKTELDAHRAVAAAERSQRKGQADALETDEKQVKDLRSEHRPANDPAKDKKPGEGLEGEAKFKAQWDADPKVRAEFGDDFKSFLAFSKAEAAGKVKVLRGKGAA